MIRLILDHGRRWSWVLGFVALFSFWEGWSIARRPEDAFEFWILLLAMWAGAILVTFDVKRGAIRPLALLPLSTRQAGRALWLATVALPALGLPMLLFLGAWSFGQCHPDTILPVGRLGLASLFVALWLGVFFNSLEAGTFSVLSSALMFAGLIYFKDTSEQPFKLVLFLAAGAFLSVTGWHRPERLFLNPASANRVVPDVNRGRGEARPPAGDGGIPLLMRTSCFHLAGYLGSMVALMALLSTWGGWPGSLETKVTLLAGTGTFMSGWFTLFYGLTPLLQHLRVLRTMPVSAARLAAVLLGITLLPFAVVGPLAAAVANLAWGSGAALIFLKSYAFVLAPLAICLSLAVWRGGGAVTYALQFAVLFGFYLAPAWLQASVSHAELSLESTVGVASLCTLLAFLLTRHALQHSKSPYQNLGVQP